MRCAHVAYTNIYIAVILHYITALRIALSLLRRRSKSTSDAGGGWSAGTVAPDGLGVNLRSGDACSVVARGAGEPGWLLLSLETDVRRADDCMGDRRKLTIRAAI